MPADGRLPLDLGDACDGNSPLPLSRARGSLLGEEVSQVSPGPEWWPAARAWARQNRPPIQPPDSTLRDLYFEREQRGPCTQRTTSPEVRLAAANARSHCTSSRSVRVSCSVSMFHTGFEMMASPSTAPAKRGSHSASASASGRDTATGRLLPGHSAWRAKRDRLASRLAELLHEYPDAYRPILVAAARFLDDAERATRATDRVRAAHCAVRLLAGIPRRPAPSYAALRAKR
jgi:hypothetical protein